MAERINKHYKPAELEAAICILLLTAPVGITEQNARDILLNLYSQGWRLVKAS